MISWLIISNKINYTELAAAKQSKYSIRACMNAICVFIFIFHSIFCLCSLHVCSFFLGSLSKYILTPNRNEVIPNQPLSPGYISDNYIKKRINITNYNYDLMDETDYSSRKSFVSNNSNNVTNGRSKLLNCSGTNVRNFLNSRPGQAVQIRTDVNGASRVNKDIDDGDNNDDDDDDNEVGESKVSTVTLASNTKALDKKIASDTNLDKFINGTIKEKLNVDTDRSSLETLSVENLPTTSKRSQNDLIQFVFTSHGIRVISDKEYVV